MHGFNTVRSPSRPHAQSKTRVNQLQPQISPFFELDLDMYSSAAIYERQWQHMNKKAGFFRKRSRAQSNLRGASQTQTAWKAQHALSSPREDIKHINELQLDNNLLQLPALPSSRRINALQGSKRSTAQSMQSYRQKAS